MDSGVVYKKNSAANYSYDGNVRPECCCGLHVRSGTMLIGLFGVLGCVTAVVLTAIYAMFLQLGIAVAALLLYALLVVACQLRQPALLVPFLVMNFVGVMFYGVVYIVSLVSLLIDLISSISVDYTSRNAMHGRMLRWLTFFQMVAVLISLVVGMWCETVVYRAYRFMKEDMTEMPAAAATHFLKPATFKKSVPGQVV